MKIFYEKQVAPIEASCCFLSSYSRPQQFLSPTSKVFRTQNRINKTSVVQTQREVNQRKQGIQAMKKSISSISLKRKNSDGNNTNRTSLNQSQFIANTQKRFIKHSMDSEVFKQYFPSYQVINANNSSTGYNPFEDLNGYPVGNHSETLDTLAQRFKHSKQVTEQPRIDQTKKYDFKPYQFSKYHQNQNLQKTSNRQIPNNSQPLEKRFQINKNFKFQQRQRNLKNPEQQLLGIIPQKNGKFTTNKESSNMLSLEMNQVDSMIIAVNAPKLHNSKPFWKKQTKMSYQNHRLSESIHQKDQNIQKTRKNRSRRKTYLFDKQQKTVNSDYEDDEYEPKQKIEQSTILMNFFNPPSFIKDKLSLSRTYQKQ